jgi:hypothetical protein
VRVSVAHAQKAAKPYQFLSSRVLAARQSRNNAKLFGVSGSIYTREVSA